MSASTRALRSAATLVALAAIATGCTVSTERIRFGPLTDRESLLTLVVTTDRDLVARECAEEGDARGCLVWHAVTTAHGDTVRAVTIVRFAPVLPSALTFEIDAHELCHAVAALQPIADPCHVGNGGVLQAHLGERGPFDSQ